MRKTSWAVLVILGLAVVSALADDPPRMGPPPLRNEARTLQPGPEHVWIPGYWKWGGINYEWVDGRWVKGKKGKVWVPGTWEQAGSHWAWRSGKWVKPEKLKAAPVKPPKPEKSK